ncbi:hypothetical protein J2S89_002918 [Arthrobacter bambusae]|nr:hypothetical protein [Arthrobacter bambusae]MDQ0098793.1 hypothetical protein [Arthrobacter bambusae]
MTTTGDLLASVRDTVLATDTSEASDEEPLR